MNIQNTQSRADVATAVNTFSSRVYGWMTFGLSLTAFIAYLIFKTQLYVQMMPFAMLIIIGTLIVGIAIQKLINKISFATAVLLFLLYTVLEGVFFGTILPAYAAAYGGDVIWITFATTALIFGIAMAYGVFTKSDLTGLKTILAIALTGLIAISLLYFVLSFFMELGWLHLLISYVGLGVFVGLTAYDAQRIRIVSQQAPDNSPAAYKLSLLMALRMYINVIMIFWYLLQIFSARRR